MLNPVYLKRQPEQTNSGTDSKIPSGIIGKPFSSESGKASSDITIGNFAKLIGQNVKAMFLIEHGYYWRPDENYIFCKGEQPAEPSRSQKRKLRRMAQKQRLEEKERLKSRWRSLYRKLCRNDSDFTWKDDSPSDNSLEETGEKNAHVESVNKEFTYSCKEADEIRDALHALGSNGILRFLGWSIEHIADDILSNPDLRAKFIADKGAFTRNRKISLADLFTFLLTMGGDNMNHEVYEYFKMTPVHPSEPAMVSRRNLLNADGVEYLMKEITSICQKICSCLPNDEAPSDIISKFQSIFATDGSGITVAHNPNDKDTYVDNGDKKGYNQYHLNCIRDGCSGLITASILQAITRLNENGAAAEMIRDMDVQGTALFEADRGYGSLNLIETIRRKEGLECLIRVKESWINETKNLPLENLDIDITIHVVTTQRKEDKVRFKNGEAKYLSGKSKFGKNKTSQTWDYESEVDVSFRIVRFQLDSGAWETLVTTLDRDSYSPEDLKKLYFLRWSNIENAFRVLKWDNHLSQMHCKLDNSSRQEIFARIAMYNIVSCVMKIAECAETCIEKMHLLHEGQTHTEEQTEMTSKNDKRKHELQINRSFATHLICDFLKNPDAINFDVIEMMLRYKVPIRKGRSFRRDLRNIPFTAFTYR